MYLLSKQLSNVHGRVWWLMHFASGLALGAVNIYFFTRSLKSVSLSIAYPAFPGTCITPIMQLFYLQFNERMNAYNIIGAFMVTGGIILLSL